MMELIFEIVFQVLGEILLQVLFEFVAELGFHSLKDTVKGPRNPILSAIGFVIWGAIAGGISLLVFPHSPIEDPTFRKFNLILTPLVAGGLMVLIGRMRNKRGSKLVRLDRFSYAFVFALAMAVVRFVWAR